MFSNHFAYLQKHPQLAATCYALISSMAFSAMSTAVRLVSDDLNAAEIMTLRNFLTLVLLLPWVLKNGVGVIRTTRLYDHAWRGFVGGIGMITWIYCLTILPLAHATALSFTAPLFSTVFAIIILKEEADTPRWLALIAGFVGVLIILRPSPAGFDWRELLVMLSTTSWAITSLFVKSLSRTEPPMRMVFYMNVFMFLLALPFGLAHWHMPRASSWGILLFIACSSILMHFTMAKAYSLARVVTLLPLDFTRLVFAALFAYIIFGETTDWVTWAGAAIIILSAVFIARRDVKAAPPVEME